MRPAEVMTPAADATALPPALEALVEVPERTTEPPQPEKVAHDVKPLRGRGERLRRSAEPTRLWPRPVEQEDLEHLRRRHRMLKERRRSRWWRLLRPLLWGAGIAAAPAVAWLWLTTSPRFALEDLAVENAAAEAASGEDIPEPRVSEAWVREVLEPFVGANLLRMSLADVAAVLEVHPWVKSASISKELPQRLSVRIVEHREVALLRHGDTFFYLDMNGRRIAEVASAGEPGSESSGPPAPSPAALPVLRLSDASILEEPAAGLELLKELESVRPNWLTGLVEIEMLGQDDYKLWIDDLPFPLLVRAGTVQDKVRRLEELLPEVTERYGDRAAVDLRFDRRIIIQPSAGDEPPGKVPSAGSSGRVAGGNS